MSTVCAQCGNSSPALDEANLRIKDLEAQVKLLNTKAAAAVDRIADYEDEVRSLKAAHAQLQQQQQQSRFPSSTQSLPAQIQTDTQTPPPPDQPANTPVLTPTTATHQNPTSPPRASRLASLSSFLPGRKRDTAILPQTPLSPSAPIFSRSDSIPTLDSAFSTNQLPSHPEHNTLHSLQTSLEAERNLRLRAESSLNQTQSELEELTATLFGQANEMVAEERRARAKLEERVKVLEDRDGEKRRRLERLEKALERIERVRTLVGREEAAKNEFQVGVMEVNNDRNDRLRVINNVAVNG